MADVVRCCVCKKRMPLTRKQRDRLKADKVTKCFHTACHIKLLKGDVPRKGK